MLRNPTTNEQNEPELGDEEELLYKCDLCGIQFGELKGNGTFYVSTKRIIWINQSPSTEDSSCYSFSSFLIQLMIHALCKEADTPYLFLQLENQENEIKIMHKSYEILQACYNALCEGQKLNPCQGDSDDGGDAFMAFGDNGDTTNDKETEKETENVEEKKDTEIMDEEERMDYIAKHFDSKLVIDNEQEMVNNNGYLEPAANGQFDDVDVDENDIEDNKLNDFDVNKIISGIPANVDVENSYSTTLGGGRRGSASFDAFGFAENIFDTESKPPTPSQSAGGSSVGGGDNPYLDPNVVKGFGQFAPNMNKTFEKKYKSYKQLEVEEKQKQQNVEQK